MPVIHRAQFTLQSYLHLNLPFSKSFLKNKALFFSGFSFFWMYVCNMKRKLAVVIIQAWMQALARWNWNEWRLEWKLDVTTASGKVRTEGVEYARDFIVWKFAFLLGLSSLHYTPLKLNFHSTGFCHIHSSKLTYFIYLLTDA